MLDQVSPGRVYMSCIHVIFQCVLQVEIASILYNKGLLITKEPLDLNLDDSDDPEDDGH